MMTSTLMVTNIGCTKILSHNWMAELERMVCGKKYGKIVFILMSHNLGTLTMLGIWVCSITWSYIYIYIYILNATYLHRDINRSSLKLLCLCIQTNSNQGKGLELIMGLRFSQKINISVVTSRMKNQNTIGSKSVQRNGRETFVWSFK